MDFRNLLLKLGGFVRINGRFANSDTFSLDLNNNPIYLTLFLFPSVKI